MKEPRSRILKATRAYMGGGGGGSTDVQKLTPKDIQQFYNFQGKQFGSYVQGQPLLSTAQGGALDFFNQFTGAGAPSLWGNSPEELRNADQAQLTLEQQAGTAHTTGSIGRELLNRENVKLQHAAQVQGLESGALNQLLGTQQAETGTFAQLYNPILSVPLANEQANIAQAQLASQQSLANQGKMGSSIGGGISAIGSIAGAAL